ncbi:MAG: glycosyltransferase family 4 protein [Vampirovibrionales bacterium]|nr:glycosyltransferase family 4 protein [Vampirovibrionales bacterium]
MSQAISQQENALNTPPQQPLRILYICHDAQLYGSQQSLLQLLKHLPSTVHAIVSVARPGPLTESLQALQNNNITVTTHQRLQWFKHSPVSHLKRLSELLSLLLIAPVRIARLVRLIRQHRVTLVHTNSVVSLEGALAAWVCRIPHVWHIRELYHPPTPKLVPLLGAQRSTQLILGLSARVICISQAVQQQLLAQRAYKAPKQTQSALNSLRVIENPVATAHAANFSPNSAQNVLQEPSPTLAALSTPPRLNAGRVNFGYVGRMSEGKRFTDILEALACLKARRADAQQLPEAHLIVAGSFADEAYEQHVQQTLDRLKLRQNVTFLGFLADPTAAYAQMQALILSSANEAFGRVLAEAMVQNIPCIATQAGGVTELITHGQTGWLYPPGNIEALTALMHQALHNPQAFAAVTSQAYMQAQARFSPQRHAQAVLSCYQQALQQGASK